MGSGARWVYDACPAWKDEGREGLWDDLGLEPSLVGDEKGFPERRGRWLYAQLGTSDTAKGYGGRPWHQCGFLRNGRRVCAMRAGAGRSVTTGPASPLTLKYECDSK